MIEDSESTEVEQPLFLDEDLLRDCLREAGYDPAQVAGKEQAIIADINEVAKELSDPPYNVLYGILLELSEEGGEKSELIEFSERLTNVLQILKEELK